MSYKNFSKSLDCVDYLEFYKLFITLDKSKLYKLYIHTFKALSTEQALPTSHKSQVAKVNDKQTRPQRHTNLSETVSLANP